MIPSRYINYTARAGDTFDNLALQAYNDERMAAEIIKANPDYADVLIFDRPAALRIPIFDNAAQPETLAPWRRTS